MDYAVITVRTKDGDWEADMALPVRMKLKKVARKVLDTVKAMDELRFAQVHKLQFIHEDRILHEEAALADYQIWDGSILFLDLISQLEGHAGRVEM